MEILDEKDGLCMRGKEREREIEEEEYKNFHQNFLS